MILKLVRCVLVAFLICSLAASVNPTCWSQCVPANVTAGDLNANGIVDFEDFLVLSANFGKANATYAQGDVQCNGVVDFADFLLLSTNFGLTGGIPIESSSQLASITSGTPNNIKRYCVNPGVMTNNVWNLTGLSHVDISVMSVPGDATSYHISTQAIFSPGNYLAPIAGQPECIEAARVTANQMCAVGDDFGVVNIVNCTNVTLRGIRVQNTQVFSGETFRSQSSCALNVSNSTGIVITDAVLKGNGKSVVLIHNSAATNSLPGVYVRNSKVYGHYFEFNIAASDVTVENTTIFQDHFAPDSHSAVTVTPAYGTQPLKLTCADGSHTVQIAPAGLVNGKMGSHSAQVLFNNVTFDMKTGRPIVSGNSSESTKICTLELRDIKIKNTSYGHKGLLRWHGIASNSINLFLTGTTKMWNTNGAFSPVNDYRTVSPTQDMVNYLTTTDGNVAAPSGIAALGRFINYDNPPRVYDPGTTTTSAGFSAYSVTDPSKKKF